MDSKTSRLRDLPSVDAVLKSNEAALLLERFGQKAATAAVRLMLSEARAELKVGASDPPSTAKVVERAFASLANDDRSTLRPLFNLTGTVLHTNLGRALIAEAAIEAAVAAMPGGAGIRSFQR